MKIRDATQLVGMLESGDLAADIGKKLRGVIVACQEASGPKRAAKGELKLKLKVEVQGAVVTFDAEIDAKVPKLSRASTVYFVTADGEIDTDHPQQIDMFPRDSARERA